jgi:hypothetical protein
MHTTLLLPNLHKRVYQTFWKIFQTFHQSRQLAIKMGEKKCHSYVAMATGWRPLPPLPKGGCPKFMCESDDRSSRKLSRHPATRKRSLDPLPGFAAGRLPWPSKWQHWPSSTSSYLWTGKLSVINCVLATYRGNWLLIEVITLHSEAKQLLANVLQGSRALKMIKIKLWITWFYDSTRWKKRWTAIERHQVRYNASTELTTRILRMGKCCS